MREPCGGGARVLLLEAGHSNRHPLLDMPPGIFKMINGSKFMRYHQTVPQAHLDGRVHDIPQGHVLGGGSSVNAQVYIRGRPSDYDAWEAMLCGENDNSGLTPRVWPRWGWCDVLPHSAPWRATTACMTLGTASTGRCWSPTLAMSTTCRAGSCRACRRWASRSIPTSTARRSAAWASINS